MKKLVLAGIIAVIVLVFFAFDLGQYLSLEYVKAQQDQVETLYAENQVATLLIFFIIYVIVTGISLPGAAVDQTGI